ncbi:MAG TPA: protein phosphatase 2C domain-containing protein, partial [Urbifossiella sp.]|nr:protein phosphatase 2C domain-containing protein [Urbifossiella sp.]
MGVAFDCFGLTDTGRVRSRNEDQFLIADLQKALRVHATSLPEGLYGSLGGQEHGKLFLVADGLGGQAGGEIASSVVVETLARYVLHTMPWFFRLHGRGEDDLEYQLRSALHACREEVGSVAEASGMIDMGTTLTLGYLMWPRLFVAHVGDSRAYLYRDGEARQITTDHTVAQRMVEKGLLTPEQAAESRWGHALMRCVGAGSPESEVDVLKVRLNVGDVLLFCTDGLSKYLDPAAIGAALGKTEPAEQTARGLVAAANAAGGNDNVTVI